VSYRAPGARVVEGETPGTAAVRAAREQLGLDVVVTDLLFADTESGADHYFFLAVTVEASPHAWDVASQTGEGVSTSAVQRTALLGWVRPPGIARGLRHRTGFVVVS
jgi:ADP-ribose pyrophosphatase YjhB (NUDIX family)